MSETPTLETLAETGNIAETLAREMKVPFEIFVTDDHDIKCVALPPGWSLAERDDSARQAAPRRKTANVRLADADGFVDYVKRHGSLTTSTLWCVADYPKGQVALTAILNDHGEQEDQPAWRDHRAHFTPKFSAEWERWTNQHGKPFSQAEFAAFVEDNLKDIAGVDGSPSGAQMLEMALTFEANQDMRFKSAIRLQNGGVQMAFTHDDDAQTLQKMQVFDRFSLGLPVFWEGDAYRLDARLRYRVPNGKLAFWFELIRSDKVLEDATQTLIAHVRDETGNPFFFGNPFEAEK